MSHRSPMRISRRKFLSTGFMSGAALCFSGCLIKKPPQFTDVPPPSSLSTGLRVNDIHSQLNSALVREIAVPGSIDECRSFFRDLCTPAELQAMADRWAVVELLERGLPYREIHRQTGVSVTTIGRVARYLMSGSGGYRVVTERLKLNA